MRIVNKKEFEWTQNENRERLISDGMEGVRFKMNYHAMKSIPLRPITI